MSKEESLPIGGYAEKAYLEYSMYVYWTEPYLSSETALNQFKEELYMQCPS